MCVSVVCGYVHVCVRVGYVHVCVSVGYVHVCVHVGYVHVCVHVGYVHVCVCGECWCVRLHCSRALEGVAYFPLSKSVRCW